MTLESERDTRATYVGPFDREPWPDRLVAHVVEPGSIPRVHGYDVADLARVHGIADIAWLMLNGELPTTNERAALEVALVLLSPVHIGEAASHAAFLSRIAGAPANATLGIAAVGLGEMARHEQNELEPWLRWLASAEGEVPAVATDPRPSEEGRAMQHWLHERLVGWFGAGRGLPDVPLHRIACAYAVLQRLGVRTPVALTTITMWARLPAVAAEAAHGRAAAVQQYPARLPDFQYVDREGSSP
jgi:hypothetical protein